MSEDHTEKPAQRLSPWASLRLRDYRLLFLLSLCATTAQQMRQTQNFYQVYEISGSAFQLGLTGVAQGVPIFVFGLFGGTLADFVDRKKLILLTTVGNLLVAVTLGVLTLSGLIQVWHIQAGTAITSALNIVLNPTRMSLISYLVPRTHLTNAVSLNSAISQGSHFIGPMLGGLSLAWMSTGNAYLFNALFYLPAVFAIVALAIPKSAGPSREKLEIASLLGGVKFLLLRTGRFGHGAARFRHHRRRLLSPALAGFRQRYSIRRPRRFRHAVLGAGGRRHDRYGHAARIRRCKK